MRIHNTVMLFGLVLLLCQCKVTSTFSTEKELQNIREVLDKQQSAWNDGDLEAYMEGYLHDSSLSFIGQRGITYGWKNTLANYKKGYEDKNAMGRLEFEVIETKVLSQNAAYMLGKYTLYRESDQPSGFFSLLWQKIEGQWVIASDHTSG